MSEFPPIEKAFVDRVFGDLSLMEIQLDVDPLQHGPKHLSGKVAGARGMLTRCERIYMQVAHMLQQYRASTRAAQLDFDLGVQHLLTNDPEVRAGRNVRDRDAIATMKMHEEHKVLSVLSAGVMDLEAVMAAIKAKRADLKDIQGRLRDQIKLCNEEIGLGSRWGSKPAPGQRTPNLDDAPRVDVTTVDALRDLFQGGDVELQAPEPEEEEESLSEASNNAIENLLEDVLQDETVVLAQEATGGFTDLTLGQLTEEEKTQKNVDHWAGTLNKQGPTGKTTEASLEEVLPSTEGGATMVDDFLQAINPAMPPRKLPNEINIDDLLGDL